MMDSSGDVTTVVIEMEPGWVYVKIADPKPEPNRIEFFLRRTIDDWFNARPTFVIDKAEAITNHGEMLGIHVWFHETDQPQQERQPEAGAVPGTLTVEVHRQIAQKFSREYVEAVLDDALKILPSYQDRQDTLVVINPRQASRARNRIAARSCGAGGRECDEGEAGEMVGQSACGVLRDAHRRELVWTTKRGAMMELTERIAGYAGIPQLHWSVIAVMADQQAVAAPVPKMVHVIT